MNQEQLFSKKRKVAIITTAEKIRENSEDTLENEPLQSELPHPAPVNSHPMNQTRKHLRLRSRSDHTKMASSSPKQVKESPSDPEGSEVDDDDHCGDCRMNDFSKTKSRSRDFIHCMKCGVWYHIHCLTKRRYQKHLLIVMGTGPTDDMCICRKCAKSPDKDTQKILAAISLFETTLKDIKSNRSQQIVHKESNADPGLVENNTDPHQINRSDSDYDELKYQNEILKLTIEELKEFKPANEDIFQALQESTILDNLDFLKQLIADYVQIAKAEMLFQEWNMVQHLKFLCQTNSDGVHIVRDLLDLKQTQISPADSRLESLSPEQFLTNMIWWFVFDVVINFHKKDFPEVKLLSSFSFAIKRYSRQRWPTKQNIVCEEVLLRAWERKHFKGAFKVSEDSLMESLENILASVLGIACPAQKGKEVLVKIIQQTVSLSTYLFASRCAPQQIKPTPGEAFDPEKHQASDRDFMELSKGEQREGKVLWTIRRGFQLKESSTSGPGLTIKAQVIVAYN